MPQQMKSTRNWLFGSSLNARRRGKKKASFRALKNQDEFIVWEHLSELLKAQPPSICGTQHGLHDMHVHFKNSFVSMNVGFALKVLNRKVWSALKQWNEGPAVQCNRSHAYRGQMGASIEFLDVFSSLYHDFFFSKKLYLNRKTPKEFYKPLDRAEAYLRNWSVWMRREVERQRVAQVPKGQRDRFRTRSFLSCQSVRATMLLLQSFREWSRDFVERNSSYSILPFRINQSRLEAFFSVVRLIISHFLWKQTWYCWRMCN